MSLAQLGEADQTDLRDQCRLVRIFDLREFLRLIARRSSALFPGQINFSERTLLEAVVKNGRQQTAQRCSDLNDAVFSRGELSRLILLRLESMAKT